MVLDDLVFDYTHAGFFHRHFCQRYTRLVGCHSRFKEDLVDLFLRISRKYGFGSPDFCDQRFEFFDGIYEFSCCLHSILSPDLGLFFYI